MSQWLSNMYHAFWMHVGVFGLARCGWASMICVVNPEQQEREFEDRDVVVIALGTSGYWLDRCVKDPEAINGMEHSAEKRRQNIDASPSASAGSNNSR
jgi:hypothetical protein